MVHMGEHAHYRQDAEQRDQDVTPEHFPVHEVPFMDWAHCTAWPPAGNRLGALAGIRKIPYLKNLGYI